MILNIFELLYNPIWGLNLILLILLTKSLYSLLRECLATTARFSGQLTRVERQLLRAHLPEVRLVSARSKPFPAFTHFSTIGMLQVDFIQHNSVLNRLSTRSTARFAINNLANPLTGHMENSERTLGYSRKGTLLLFTGSTLRR
jgi:hypothetical protein